MEGDRKILNTYKITPDDYPEILRADPFANGPTSPDPSRYIPLPIFCQYHTIADQNETTTQCPKTLATSVKTTKASSSMHSTKYSYSADASIMFQTFFQASLKEQDTWTWTIKDDQSTANITTEQAQFTVIGPSPGYAGPTDFQFYYDTLFKSFLLAEPKNRAQISVRGTLRDSTGRPLSLTEVSLIANGVEYTTLTDPLGEYKFFGAIPGPIELYSDGIILRLVAQPNKSIDLIRP
jgi:hypothetical protein